MKTFFFFAFEKTICVGICWNCAPKITVQNTRSTVVINGYIEKVEAAHGARTK